MESFKESLISYLMMNGRLTTREIYALFPDMNKQTVSWHLNQELMKGNIRKAGHGVYEIGTHIPEKEERQQNIPELSKAVYECLSQSGYDFYLSGLDCMNGLGFKVDGQYPVIICVRKECLKDVQLLLMREFDLAITEEEKELLGDENLRRRIQFVVLKSSDFALQKEHFAFKEKGFVDLYYAVTRLEYPLDVAELPHVLSLISPNAYRFRRATKDRGLSSELDFLLSYNKDFVKALAKYL